MSVTIKMKDDQALIDFKGVHNTVINAIRRTILDDVPTFAIEDVEVVLNESPLYDETIAHRLGLIPIKTDLKSYNFKSDCKCGGIGCAMCEVKMILASEDEGYVFSGSIKSDDPQVVPIDEKIPITKLLKDKKIEMNIKAVLGTGRVHAKWAPAHTYLKDISGGTELVIESFGQLDEKTIYNNALDILVKKINDLEGSL